MSRRVKVFSIALGLVCACSQASETRIPGIAVFVRAPQGSTKQVQSGGAIEFSGVAEVRTVVIRNIGYATLKVQEIRLDGDNPQFSIDLKDLTFPKEIGPAEGAIIPSIEFDIAFSPSGPAGEPRTLVIVSNDPVVAEFRASVSAAALAPNIEVNLGNGPVDAITPIGQPWMQEFVVTNTGTADLVITAPVELQDPQDPTLEEFTIFKPLEVGSVIHPKGSAASPQQATFSIRYLPKDGQPDENHILVHSNDPDTPIYSIWIRGNPAGQGDILVQYADQATGLGCVDFSQVTEAGQVCTKVVNVRLAGGGQVTVRPPKVAPADAYSVEWYAAGGTQAGDPTGCGAYQGTALGLEPAVLTAMRPSLDIAVTYTAPGAKGVNGTLTIEYVSTTPAQKEVPLCGGVAKGVFGVAPPQHSDLWFFVAEGQSRKKSVVIQNTGNGPLAIRNVEVLKNYPTVDPDAFFLVDPPAKDYEIPAYGLYAMEVEFRTDYEVPAVNASLRITYHDDITDSDQWYDVPLHGRKDFEGVTLPTAAVKPVANAKAGQPLLLDGSGSTGGTYSLPSSGQNGFRWFLIRKPQEPKDSTTSRVFLNLGDAGPTVSVTPDVAGEYEFGLVVYACEQQTSTCYFSDEARITVTVAP